MILSRKNSYSLKTRHIIYVGTIFLGSSFLGYFHEAANIAAFIGFALFCLTLGLWRREYALYLAFLELILGSFGYLLSLSLGGLNLPLRMAFFVIIMGLWLKDTITDYKLPLANYKNNRRTVISLGIFFIIWAAGIVSGYARGHNPADIFFDANSYLYLLLFLPAIKYLDTKEKIYGLQKVLLIGAAVLAVETFALFIVFINGKNIFMLEIIYKWMRDFRIGEITSLKNGTYRVFLQSQIYLPIGCLLAAAFYFYKRIKLRIFLLFTALFGGAIYISLSRSLWVGLAAGLAALFILPVQASYGLRPILYNFLKFGAGFLFGIAVVFLLTPKDASLLGNRLKVGQSALNTRIEQLKPLLPAIKNNPVFGYGFGKTLTFKSFDPRVTYMAKDGSYTTYAFEWGYLDMVLKFGALGLFVYLYFVGQIAHKLWKKLKTAPASVIWALASLVVLLTTHIFTPYLNHPLGIGVLIMGAAIAALDKHGGNE